MTPYPHLFSPIQIGRTTVKNRVFMPPISTNLADKGYVTDTLVEHYAARARGGVGLIVTEVTTVEPTYTYLPGDMSLHDDSFLPGWEKLTAAVHRYGVKLLPQLFHPAYMAFPLPGTPRLIAPSAVGPYYAKEAPRAVTVQELAVIVGQFRDAALRVRRAGADGVEIHAAHAHGLLGGFLSPLYNKRTDAYGGDLNGRLRLTLEVLQAVRAACGADFIIDVRISGDEYSDGGLGLNDMIYVAKRLEAAGADLLHVSGGTTILRGSSIPAPGTRQGTHAHTAAEIRRFVSIPVATVGRINEPWLADELIANQKADACMIGRANLCDPEFANKAREGREGEIRPCIGCLRCLNGIMFGKPVACTVNPSFQLENEETLPPSAQRKNVLVIGGGPAGLEAAFVAARRGHHVVLCEAEDTLGGQLRLAAVPIAKQELTKVIQFLENRLERAGVEVRRSCRVDGALLARCFQGYEVVACSGARPAVIPAFTGFKHWATADDVLAGRAFPGRKTVILGGGAVGCETADFLAPPIYDQSPRDREILLLELLPGVMSAETGPGRSLLVRRMLEKGVQLLCGAKVERVEQDKIYYTRGGQTHCISDADTLVFANGYRPDETLPETLRDSGLPFHIIGDAHTPGTLKDAILAGYELARRL